MYEKPGLVGISNSVLLARSKVLAVAQFSKVESLVLVPPAPRSRLPGSVTPPAGVTPQMALSEMPPQVELLVTPGPNVKRIMPLGSSVSWNEKRGVGKPNECVFHHVTTHCVGEVRMKTSPP